MKNISIYMFNAFYLFPKVIRKDILSTPMKQPNYLQKKKQDDPTIYSECLSLSLNDEDKLLFLFLSQSPPPLPQYQSDLQQKVTVHSCSWQELDLFRGTELHSCFTMCLGLVGSGLEWRWDCLDLIDWTSQLWSKVNGKARKGSSTSQPWNALTW